MNSNLESIGGLKRSKAARGHPQRPCLIEPAANETFQGITVPARAYVATSRWRIDGASMTLQGEL
jgi:hypothetical protein